LNRMWVFPGLLVLTISILACSSDPAPGDDDSDPGDDDSGSAAGDDDSADDPILGPWDEPFTWEAIDLAPCPAEVPADDPVVSLLDAMELDLSIGIDHWIYEAYGGSIEWDRARLSHFHTLQQELTSIPCFGGNLALRADAAWATDHPLATLVADAATSLDLTLTVGAVLPHADEADSPLMEALDALNEGEDWDRDAALAAAASVPLAVQRAAARVLLASIDATQLRDQGITELIDASDMDDAFERTMMGWLPSYTDGIDPDDADFAELWTVGTTGHATLYSGGVRLARVLDEIDWEAVAAGAEGSYSFAAPTPAGQVVIRGTGDDTYDPEQDDSLEGDFLLVLDSGGDDLYRIPAGATSSVDNPVSVHLDLGGHDTYGYVEVGSPYDTEGLLVADEGGRYSGDFNYGPFSLSATARQGAGILGYGFLIDLGSSNDSYQSLRMSQGYSCVGVGILHDDGGNDTYEAENAAQGAAMIGIAGLLDGGGTDTYRSFQNSQAFGWVNSYGMLYEAAGDDQYELVVTEVLLYDSPQTSGWANSSLGQGTAFGWRRDTTGTHLSGGLALHRDLSGNDTYEGSTFVQGTGYWMGMGVMADGEGDDRYNGVFYAQGAGAHFALATFLEGDGNDTYNGDRSPTHSVIGLAHDYSAVVFVDEAGDDTYTGPDRSIGASKCHGMGLLVDVRGDDYYEGLHDRSIGWATDYDWAPGTCGDYDYIPSYGFFVDADGVDTYVKPDPTGYGDDLLWITDDPDDEDALEYGGGIDVSGAATYAQAYGAGFR